jgi:hypothetical protein
MIPKKRWLEPYPWEIVTYLNYQACKAGTRKYAVLEIHDSIQQQWEQRLTQDQTLREAIEICRECHRSAPFRFFNGNTFTAVARSLVQEICKELEEVEAHLFRGAVEHYVAGTIAPEDFDAIYRSIDRMLEELGCRKNKPSNLPD